MFFLGGFMSGYLFGYFSNKIGRRPVLLILVALGIISILVCSLSPQYQVFVIGYYLCGFSLFGYQTSIYSYIGEISAVRFRTISINMLTMVWAGTPIVLPLINLFHNWRHPFLILSVILMGSLPFAYMCFLQSPRYLVLKRCYAQARAIFQRISNTNQRPPYKFRLVEELEKENQTYLVVVPRNQNINTNRSLILNHIINHNLNGDKSININNNPTNNNNNNNNPTNHSYSYLDLFRYPSLRQSTIILMIWWLFRFVMYYGLNLALQSLVKSGWFLTLIISGTAIMEVIGSFGVPLLTTLLCHKYKLDIMRFCLLMITLCCTTLWFIVLKSQCYANITHHLCYQIIVVIIIVVSLRFFGTVFFSSLVMYYSQVYPTSIRSLGCNFTLTFGRLGSILVPFYINYMREAHPGRHSVCLLAPFGLLAFILTYFMPYTEEVGIRDKIVEEEEMEAGKERLANGGQLGNSNHINSSHDYLINENMSDSYEMQQINNGSGANNSTNNNSSGNNRLK